MEPLTVYKFTHKKYRDNILSGESIKIGTMSYFRGMEYPDSKYFSHLENNLLSKDAHKHLNPQGGIDDPYEGRTVVHVGEIHSWLSDHVSSAKVTSDRLGIDVFGGFPRGYTTVRNNIYILQVPNYYIFCTSSFVDKETIDRMKHDSAKYSSHNEAYDTIIPITDYLNFTFKMREGICRAIGIEDPESIRMISKSVDYESRIYGVGDHNSKLPDPFVKHTFFKAQNEYRSVLDYELPNDEKSILISLGSDVDGIFGEPLPI